MTNRQKLLRRALGCLAATAIAAPALAQIPVDDSGNTIGEWEAPATQAATGNEGIPLLSPAELQDLVGPVALYPDDLLAIVLPASTYPLQVVQAARFLEDLEANPGLKPDEDWDDSIIALLNYPEVIELLNEDLDWTWQLGEAVVAQQTDVVAAVEGFRDTAYAAGNLQSDDYQEVSRDEGVIQITPVNDDVIYVPYYEPERVVVYQPRPVYHYYERPYPVYYYPYPDSYSFRRGFFWGVTTAFTIGWASDHLHVYHHSYRGHPYYGRHYYNRWSYRRPSINVHNTVYINNRGHVNARRYSHGDYWQPSRNTRLRFSDQRVTRNTHYPRRERRNEERRSRNHVVRNNTDRNSRNRNNVNRDRVNNEYRFRDRSNERARERSARQPVVTPTPPTDRSQRRENPRSQARNERIHEARGERRSQPSPRSRSERRSERPRQARNERRSQPQQQARNERQSPPAREARSERPRQARNERRSQPQQQARNERQSPPAREARSERPRQARNERRSQPQQQARNERQSRPAREARSERRSESRRGSRDELQRRRR